MYISGCDPKKRLIQVKCKLLAPADIKIPVIALNINDKFLAPKCRTCAELKCKNMNYNAPCEHNDDERALYGFFDEVELIHAVNLGYLIMDVYETHLYQTTSFNDPDFGGNAFIKRQMFMKSLHSD